LNNKRIRDVNLCLITDRTFFSAGCSMYFAVEAALDAGVRAVQLREKDLPAKELFDMALWMRELTIEYGALLFINDRVDVALSVSADGVHLSRSGLPVQAVRQIAGETLIIGVSAHSLDEAIQAQKAGADFLTFGPVYETASKMKYGEPVGIESLRNVKSRAAIPVFAIGGIKPDKVKEVRAAGADGIAVISAILAAKDIGKTTETFLRLLK
jgi:thiamine-phosphate pyrophosphorylase